MKAIYLSAVLLVSAVVDNALGCDLPALKHKFERAMEAREHAYMFEGIDDVEAATEMRRHIGRLDVLLDVQPGCEANVGAQNLLSYAKRLRSSAAAYASSHGWLQNN